MNMKIVKNFITEILNFIPSIHHEDFDELILVFLEVGLSNK